MLERIGCETCLVRHPAQLEGLSGLILPGGESTAIAKLMVIHGMYAPIRNAYAQGMALFGTCAGAILLAREIEGGRSDQEALGLMDIRARRNAYGRQIDSFETTVSFTGVPGEEVRGTFIRAPRFDRLGAQVVILSSSDEGEPLAVREGHALAVAFHPELTDDTRVHEYFVGQVVGGI